MLRRPSLTLLQTFMLLVAVAFAYRYGAPTYELCEKQHRDCIPVRYRAEDETKGAGCRAACGKQRGDLSEKMTVYFCEEYNQPCKPYEVYGRSGYAENFERHAMCVSLCQFVAKVEHSSENYFEMCPDSMDPCLEIKRINGTFDAFNKCAFKCDGWPKLENSLEDTAIFCPHEGICEEAKFFSNPNAGNAFAGLKKCFTDCMSEYIGKSPAYEQCKQQNRDCELVNYRTEDETKGAGCRAACAKQQGDLNEKMTVYFCENYNKPCKPYEVYGRSGYAENVERNTKCVKLCHFDAKVENIREDTAVFCPNVGACTEAKFFSNPKAGNAFAGLKTCLTNCMSEYKDQSPTYELCEKQHRDCTLVRYRAEDKTKGEGCRNACGMQRGDLSEKMTVYFCEEFNEPCKPYDVYGRSGYAENFERHVMCVSLCHFVAKVEHSSVDYFDMFSVTMDFFLEIKRINGTFGAFNKCVFEYDGWPKHAYIWH